MAERKSDRWISLTQSVLLHAVVVGALAYGFYSYKQKPPVPAPTLAVEGTLVDSRDVKVSAPKPDKPAPPAPKPDPVPEPEPPPPVEDVGPPTPTPEETQAREQQEREAAEAKQKVDEQRQADEERQVQERQAAEAKSAAEQKAREEADQKKREQAKKEQDKRDAEKKAADAKKRADDQRKAEEDKARAAREAELRRSLEQEEHAVAMRSSGAMLNWQAQITARIQRAWLRPPSAKPGIDCVVYVTQVPGGEVTNVRVGACNGDASLRESIESAVLRASPLPPPPDPSLFERNLEIRFVPTE